MSDFTLTFCEIIYLEYMIKVTDDTFEKFKTSEIKRF